MPIRDTRTLDANAVAVAAAGLVRQATISPENRASYLTPARELWHFHIGGERADIREWPVYTRDGRLVGAVDRLLVEAATRRIRYASVSLAFYAANDHKPTVLGSVLVPIGAIRRVDERQALVLDGLTSEQLVNAPRLHARPITRADEDATLAVYGMPTSRDVPPGTLYDGPTFDDRRLIMGPA